MPVDTTQASDAQGRWSDGCESKLGGVVQDAVPVPCPEFPPPAGASLVYHLSGAGRQDERS